MVILVVMVIYQILLLTFYLIHSQFLSHFLFLIHSQSLYKFSFSHDESMITLNIYSDDIYDIEVTLYGICKQTEMTIMLNNNQSVYCRAKDYG